MALMTVNNHDEQGKDYRSQPRWSAGKKTEVVLRLLRGESLEELSRERQVEAHRRAAWRDDFLAAGSQGLKGQRSDHSTSTPAGGLVAGQADPDRCHRSATRSWSG